MREGKQMGQRERNEWTGEKKRKKRKRRIKNGEKRKVRKKQEKEERGDEGRKVDGAIRKK